MAVQSGTTRILVAWTEAQSSDSEWESLAFSHSWRIQRAWLYEVQA